MFTRWFDPQEVTETPFGVSEGSSRMIFRSVYAAVRPTTRSDRRNTVFFSFQKRKIRFQTVLRARICEQSDSKIMILHFPL